MSMEYLARPDTFCGPSILEMRLPIKVRLSASGHLYSAIALPSFLGRLRDRRSNAHVGAAAAGIAAQSLLDLFGGGGGVLVQEGLAGNHETGVAQATLLRIVIDEGLLYRMEIIALHQPLDGSDRFTLNVNCESRARIDGFAVYNHRARSSTPAIADSLCPGHIQILSE